MQLVQLRFRAVCAVCASKLPPRAEAWQDDAAQRTICLSCQRAEAQAQEAAAVAEAARNRQPVPDLNRAPRLVPARPGDRDDEGDGADDGTDSNAEADQVAREHDRLAHERREAERMEWERAASERREHEATVDQQNRNEGGRSGAGGWPRRPGNGSKHRSDPLSARPPAAGVAPDGSTRLPQVGPSLAAASGVDRVGEEASDNAISRALEAARPHGLEIIRSRPWAGTRVESEAIVVGPSGVWIVGGLGDTGGPVERGFLAGHGGSELLNVVGGRTSIMSGLLFDSPFQWVPVRGALCFDSGIPSWFDVPFSLAGIAITTPRDLVDSLFMPLHLDAETRQQVAQHLVNRF